MMTVTARTAAGEMGITATAQMTAAPQTIHSPLRQRSTKMNGRPHYGSDAQTLPVPGWDCGPWIQAGLPP